jgi:hypothetical protein
MVVNPIMALLAPMLSVPQGLGSKSACAVDSGDCTIAEAKPDGECWFSLENFTL